MLVLALLCALIVAAPAVAAPADLDPAFGAGGILINSLVPAQDTAEDVAIQPDGKIVIAGRAFIGAGFDMLVARFNPDGTPDTGFGGGDGFATESMGTALDAVEAVVVQPNGRIVVAGYTDAGPKDQMAALRFLPDGTLDDSFSTDGRANYWYGLAGTNDSYAVDVAIQSDGKLLLAGFTDEAGTQDFAVIRINTDGTLDDTFSGDGRQSLPIGAGLDRARAVVVQPDGKILVAGESDGGVTNYDFAIVRLDANGTLDPAFNGGGIQLTSLGVSDDYARSIALRHDGSIVVGGGSRAAGIDNTALVRYTAAGLLDPAFGAGGIVKTFVDGWQSTTYEIALQNNDKIVAGGFFYDGLVYDFFAAQYDSTGALDQTFGSGGIRRIDLGSTGDYVRSVAVQPNGGIVLAGESLGPSNFDVALVRLLGEPVFLPPTPPPVPVATISSPRSRVVSAKRLKRLAGTAGPPGMVSKVEIALRRVDRRALKRGKCLWLRGSNLKFTKVKAKRKRCTTRKFLRAKGTESWSFKLRKPLPKGRYELSVRVTLTTGARTERFAAVDGTFRAFRLK